MRDLLTLCGVWLSSPYGTDVVVYSQVSKARVDWHRVSKVVGDDDEILHQVTKLVTVRSRANS